MRKTIIAAVVAAASIVGACKKPEEARPQQPIEVYVTPVVQQDVPVYVDLVGQADGFQNVEIRARVEGWLESVNFREGSFVRKGALLYRIDPKPFQVALKGAQADLARSQATLEKTENDVSRYTPLAAKQAVSQQELDNALSARQAARAQIAAEQAGVDEAKLNLGYTRITSPIDGLSGATQVKVGNLVGRGLATPLTTISVIDPIIFHVSINEADYLQVARRAPERIGGTPRLGNIVLTLADGTVYPQKGRVGLIERAVDPTTGTLGVQLYFPNPQKILRPNQYGRARVLIDTRRGALLVPQRAVQQLQNLFNVAVVDAENRVAFKNVTVGPRVDTRWVIEKGLERNERVVVEGLQRIRDGMTVAAKLVSPNETESLENDSVSEAK